MVQFQDFDLLLEASERITDGLHCSFRQNARVQLHDPAALLVFLASGGLVAAAHFRKVRDAG